MSADDRSPAALPNARPPHPATLPRGSAIQRKEGPRTSPHPATVVAERAPHPATVVQRREALPPHPATVVQRREAPFGRSKVLPPHPATVVQRREAPAGIPKAPPPHPATVRRGEAIQRAHAVFNKVDPDFSDEDAGSDDAPSFEDTINELSFEDLTSDAFRNNHVVETNLVANGLVIATKRKKPLSTVVLLDAKAKEIFCAEIRKKTLNLTYANVYRDTKKNINTSEDIYSIVEYTQEEKSYTKTKEGTALLVYGVTSAKTVGGYMYTAHHIETIRDYKAS